LIQIFTAVVEGRIDIDQLSKNVSETERKGSLGEFLQDVPYLDVFMLLHSLPREGIVLAVNLDFWVSA
jgi:hypothetical protein